MKRLATSTYKNYTTLHGTITYGIADGEVYIISYSGHDTELCIPEQIDDLPVVCIAKKAFLSNKLIREVLLPPGINEIGDFAFARCSRLKKIGIPYQNIDIGQGILMECDSLVQVVDTKDPRYYKNISEEVSNKMDTNDGNIASSKIKEDISYLLAATVLILDATYLFDLSNAGSDDWFFKWDSRMRMKMGMDDSEGFSKMLLCGEEDYGSNETDPEYYKHLKRIAKVRVAMLRLMHNAMLSEKEGQMLRDYLLLHISGCKHDETWNVILEEHGDDKEYYEFLINIGGVSEKNFHNMLSDMGDRHTEMKAFLMKHIESLNENKDVFAEFDL